MTSESDKHGNYRQGADWTRQQERSNLAILRLMVWISLTFGRAIGRLVLYGIAAYYVVFAPSARRASRDYLHRALDRWAEWSDGGEGLDVWLKRTFKVDSARFLTAEAAPKVITALKAMKAHKRAA